MSACKSHQRQIALLSVQALSESEGAVVREHLRDCAACRAYSKQLEGIVGLYTEDAERPITPSSVAAPRFERKPVPSPWFEWLKPAMAALAAVVTCGTLLLMRHRPEERDLSPPTVASHAPAVPSIANLRRLTSADLEQLTQPEPARNSARTELVFSVGTRDDGS